MRHPAFTFAPNFINNQNKSSMAIKKVSNEFMAKVLNDVAWKALSNTSNEILFHEECIEHFKTQLYTLLYQRLCIMTGWTLMCQSAT